MARLKTSMPWFSPVKLSPTASASASPAKPATIGTKRRPLKKARYSGSFRVENRL